MNRRLVQPKLAIHSFSWISLYLVVVTLLCGVPTAASPSDLARRSRDTVGVDGSRNPTDSPFTLIAAELPGVTSGSAVWGRFRSECYGDLQLLLTGWTGSSRITRIYDSGDVPFTEISEVDFPGVRHSSVALGDYNGDGKLDILLTGESASGPISRIYRNDTDPEGGSLAFTDIGAGIPGVAGSSVAWGDCDNDGDLDFVLTGLTEAFTLISKIYRNDDGAFTDIGAGLPGVYNSTVAWADYDLDGDLDLLLAGEALNGFIARIYRNGNGVFEDSNAGLPGVSSGSAAWGDYDQDGDMDILLTGETEASGLIARIYRNDAGSFADIGAGLPGVTGSSGCWGDCDNDGDLDVLLSGSTGAGRICEVYRNDGETFVDINAGLVGAEGAAVGWCDLMGDGDLDVAVTGMSESGPVAYVYLNNYAPDGNDPPSAPYDLSVSETETSVTFSWQEGWDDHTSQTGLTHNLIVGSGAWGQSIVPGMAEDDGDRLVLQSGNMGLRDSWTIAKSALPAGETIYWSVQAVDNSFLGGEFAPLQAYPQFENTGAGLPGLQRGAMAWGDFDNDQDLDLAVAGRTTGGAISRIYRNDAGIWTEVSAGLDGVEMPAVAWGDYDNDGDLDILLVGDTGSGYTSRIYRNDDGSFSDIGAGLVGVYRASAAWGDIDADGDLDLALSGATTTGPTARIYRNTGGSFTDIGAGLTGLEYCSLAWGDYDNDGDLDLVLAGRVGGTHSTKLYSNDAGVFADATAGLPGVSRSSVSWGDYDNDGDQDLLLVGHTGSSYITKIYANTSGSFADAGLAFPGVRTGSAAWGDYDNDGDLDFILTGEVDGSTRLARIYRNDGGSFSIGQEFDGLYLSSVAWGDCDNDGDLDLVLTGAPYLQNGIYENQAGSFVRLGCLSGGVSRSCVSWGDYDADGDLDLLLAGETSTGDPSIAKVYRNNFSTPGANAPPGIPTGLWIAPTQTTVTFHWSAPVDDHTPQQALSYNIRVGRTPGADDIVSGMARLTDGRRSVPRMGNVGQRLSWTIPWTSLFSSPFFYWTVQAIDASFLGSNWAILNEEVPTLLTHLAAEVGVAGVTIEWSIPIDHVLSGFLLDRQAQGNLQPERITAEPIPWRVGVERYRYTDETAEAGTEYTYILTALSPDGEQELGRVRVVAYPILEFAFSGAAPNPFTAASTLAFVLPRADRVRLDVFDLTGRRVRRLLDEARQAGRHQVFWDGSDDDGRRLVSGAYFARIRMGDFVQTRRMTILH